METQLAELTKVISQLGTVFLFSLWVLIFLIGSVIVAEFIRRERTLTKDDDWIERKSKTCCEHLKSDHRKVFTLGLRYVRGSFIGQCNLCDCQRYYRK